ncbi:MAG TPA: hypothetical protein PLB19_01145 [Candidatus Paceibacterota bacterium]|nr:hypothetical protein [Candidatus Paceibacterota bacterium]HPQ22895.1 hypothetical protein [Candidatus Paceibacterota bacterium]
MKLLSKFKFLFSLSIASILLILPLIMPNFVLADGMIINIDPYSDRWDYLNESNQQAFINYEDGLEKMILSIGLEKTSENAVWIFPVPAEPTEVAIDVVTRLPKFIGEDIFERAKSNLFIIRNSLLATQIYPIPFFNWGVHVLDVSDISIWLGDKSKTDVIVHEHLDKEGLTTEIITARTAQSLYQYLQDKNLKIEEGSIPVIDHYIGKKFTFVVSWISENPVVTPETQLKQRGVFVTFPTEEIYYPLLPTSVYGSEIIPITIKIIGYRSPKIFEEIKNYTEVKYFINNLIVDSDVNEIEINKGIDELENFYSDSSENDKYTKIEIKAPSKFLVDDLWINPEAPLKVYYSSFIAQYGVLIEIILLILISMVASIVAGWLIFRDLRNKNGIFKLALVGLSNCFSLIGLIIATIFLRTKAEDEKVSSLLKEIKQKGYMWKRRLAVILLIVVLSLFISGLLSSLDFIVPFLVLVFTLFIRRIKPEDKPLFAQLKSAGYSLWLFIPKDKRKFIFVPLFSLIFVNISLLIVKLIEITL